MRNFGWLVVLCLLGFLGPRPGWTQDTEDLADWTLEVAGPVPPGEAARVVVVPPGDPARSRTLRVGAQSFTVQARDTLSVPVEAGQTEIEVSATGQSRRIPVEVIGFPLWLSILPPLIAIVLALVLREVIVSLFVGVFFGAAVLGYYDHGSLSGIFAGLLTTLDTYIVEALVDSSHISIILFSLLIGGMVSLISRNGGMQGIVDRIARLAQTARSGQLATWLLGLVIFFDDYANSLVVGNTMRPITDRLRISREKLSYIVDSTAAPVSALAFITTWIGAELGYIADGIEGLPGFPEEMSPYSIFLSSLSYAFYPILTLIFIFILVWRQRDFGTMLQAERRARRTGEVSRPGSSVGESDELKHFQPKEGVRIQAFRAVVPVGVLVLGVFIGLLYTGWDSDTWQDPTLGGIKKMSTIIGNADSYAALMWASLSAVIVAIALSLGQDRLKLNEAIEVMTSGFKAMFGALTILTLAWALQGVTEDMHTADFLTHLLSGQLAPAWLPTITFLLGAVIAFSTGSSWGTMAILYPIVIPLTWAVGQQNGLFEAESLSIMANSVACVLGGAVLGDHCSPISDTTILSSLATSTDHIDHVRTQLPYALTVGSIALLAGTLPTGYGLPSWVSFLIGIGACWAVIHWLGKPSEDMQA